MRAIAIAALVAAAPAQADDMLGFRLGFGRLELRDDRAVGTTQLGLGIEHPLCGSVRIVGEYELLWITNNPDDASMDYVYTMGHRGQLGLRRELGSIRRLLYADIEAGVGLGVYDTLDATHVAPHAFAGLRAGYHLRDNFDDPRAARAFETEIMVRVLAVEHGFGVVAGFGLYWGE